jgi:integrase
MNVYKLKEVSFHSGERFPMLLNEYGLPVFDVTVYALTELRTRNQATASISSALRAIQILYYFLESRDIDLRIRLRTGCALTMSEIEDLCRLCRLSTFDIRLNLASKPETSVKSLTKLESIRMKTPASKVNVVVPVFAATRIRYIKHYLSWFASSYSATQSQQISDSIIRSNEQMEKALAARIPSAFAHLALHQREGLSEPARAELLRIIDPLCSDNPWRDDFTRHRNYVIVSLFYYLGMRRGELLGLRVEDIHLRARTLTIHRSADDAKDTRKIQPQTKTRARKVPIGEEMASLLRIHIIEFRSKMKRAKKHPFLFVATHTGAPMSIPAVAKIFDKLKAVSPLLLERVHPHVLRHTWNDLFSEEMDKNRVPEEAETKMRAYLMGWSDTSSTAATYTRRHTRKKALEVSLIMQERTIGERK